jgi:hypothetical protein
MAMALDEAAAAAAEDEVPTVIRRCLATGAAVPV